VAERRGVVVAKQLTSIRVDRVESRPAHEQGFVAA
jgi:hypothetical protein